MHHKRLMIWGGGNPEKVRLRGTCKVRAGLALHARRTRYPEDDTAHVQMYRPAADTRLRMSYGVAGGCLYSFDALIYFVGPDSQSF